MISLNLEWRWSTHIKGVAFIVCGWAFGVVSIGRVWFPICEYTGLTYFTERK